jgi:hypothetical protein
MANFNYRRFFIILRAKDTGFELNDKEPSGYCKIDIKNNRIKFLIYVQDLKPQTSDQGIYEAYIVSPREEKPAYKLADIFVDNRGRAECNVESDTETLKRTTKSLEEFSAITVVYKSLTHTRKLHYVLVGSAGKRAELDWSGRIMADILKVSGTELKEQQIPDESKIFNSITPEKTVAPEEVIPNKVTEPEKAASDWNMPLSNDLCSCGDTEQNEDTKTPGSAGSQTALSDESNDIGLEFVVRHEESDSKEIIVEKIKTHDKIAFEDDEKPDDKTDEAKCLPFSSTNYWDFMKDYFMKISKENPRVYPFGYNDDRKWVKVEHIPDGYSKYCNQRSYMDFNSADPLRRDPESLAHYLVGFIDQDENISYVIYGFPGYSYEQPPAYAIHGLSVWEPLKNGYGKGYWLIYIDAQTGDLVQRP